MVSAADELFMGFGADYYVAGRSAALAQRLPVVGNLFHHAIEMMLKARLVQKHSLRELARDFGHDLASLWKAFKADFPGIDLSEFDDTVASLATFERLRYPDAIIAEGMGVRLDWSRPDPPWPPTGGGEPECAIVVNDIDHLVAKIFEVSSRNPLSFIKRLNDHARAAVTYQNPVAGIFLRPV